MSDQMEDEELLKAIFDEIEVLSFAPDDVVRRKAETVIRTILAAGYRIVKPADDEWGEFCGEPKEDKRGRNIRRAGVRREAIEMVLNDADPDVPIYELITVEVSRASLLAELESMKEAGE